MPISRMSLNDCVPAPAFSGFVILSEGERALRASSASRRTLVLSKGLNDGNGGNAGDVCRVTLSEARGSVATKRESKGNASASVASFVSQQPTTNSQPLTDNSTALSAGGASCGSPARKCREKAPGKTSPGGATQ